MKYIRTKDGIYEPLTDINSKSYNFKAKFYDSYILVSKSTIVKAADTIEELCDFYVVDKHYPDEDSKLFFSRANGWKCIDQIKTAIGLDNWKSLYAYIFGEQGDIIKVAKMNDKGELCLL